MKQLIKMIGLTRMIIVRGILTSIPLIKLK